MLPQVRALGPLIEKILRGPTLIKVKSVKSDFDRRAAADFEAAFLRNQQSKRELHPGGQCSRGRAIRRCRKQGVPSMMGPHNVTTSSGPGASLILRSPTLIKVKSVKSDFDRRDTAAGETDRRTSPKREDEHRRPLKHGYKEWFLPSEAKLLRREHVLKSRSFELALIV